MARSKTESFRRKDIAITIDPRIYQRIRNLVDSDKRENVSRVVEECLIGYLHVIEAECGREFVQAQRANRTSLDILVKLIKAVTDAGLLGESLALAYDRKAVEAELKALAESRDEREKLDRENDATAENDEIGAAETVDRSPSEQSAKRGRSTSSKQSTRKASVKIAKPSKVKKTTRKITK